MVGNNSRGGLYILVPRTLLVFCIKEAVQADHLCVQEVNAVLGGVHRLQEDCQYLLGNSGGVANGGTNVALRVMPSREFIQLIASEEVIPIGLECEHTVASTLMSSCYLL
jgi:hypothetical protein